jgi:hypothetical protein
VTTILLSNMAILLTNSPLGSWPKMEVNKDDSMVDEVTAMNVIPDMVDQGELHTVHEDLNEDSREDVDQREA